MVFEFFVQSTTGQKISISTLGPDNTVADIKARLEETEGLQANMVHLIHSGKKLEDDTTLANAKITAGTSISMVMALRAGH